MRVAPSIIYTIFVGLRKWFSDKRKTIFTQKRAPGRLPRLATQLFCNNGKTIATKVVRFSNKKRGAVGPGGLLLNEIFEEFDEHVRHYLGPFLGRVSSVRDVGVIIPRISGGRAYQGAVEVGVYTT